MEFDGGSGVSLIWNNKMLAYPGDMVLRLTKLEANA